MGQRSFGVVVTAGVFLAAGLAGFCARWAVWPRSVGTSPLMAILALTSGVVYTATAILTWRRSRYAALSFVAALASLLLSAWFLVPGGEVVIPAMVVLTLVTVIGLRYLRGLGLAEA